MVMRLDEIPEEIAQGESTAETVVEIQIGGGFRLSDVPEKTYNPIEGEKKALKVFNRAEEQKIPMTLATYQIQQEVKAENYRRNLHDLKKAGFDVEPPFSPVATQGTIEASPDLSFGETVAEGFKAGKRGVLNVLKAPGIAIKAVGEQAPTREQRDQRLAAIEQAEGRAYPVERGLNKAASYFSKNLVKIGDNCINYYNGISEKTPMSQEMQWAMQQPFGDNPIARVTVAAGESVPTYGTAVAATLLTKNPSIGLALLGGTSATQTYEDLRADDVDPDIALFASALVGSIEVVTEKVPFDMLLKNGGMPLLKRAVISGTAESFQELFAQLGQNYVTAVAGDIEDEGFIAATRQEWSTIANGWQDAMSVGFLFGGLASIFTPKSAPESRKTVISSLNETKATVKAAETARQEAAVVEEKPEPAKPKQPAFPPEKAPKIDVGPAVGEGEEKVRGLSLSIEAQAIEKGLVESLGDLPTYRTINLTEQAERLADFVASDPERAMRVAMAQEDPPAGSYPENVFTAVRAVAMQNGDAQTLKRLATSEVTKTAMIMGQRIKSLDTGETGTDPVRAMQDISELRKEVARGRKKNVATDEELRELQSRLDIAESRLAEYAAREGKKAPRKNAKGYGEKNTIVQKAEYLEIINRRKNLPPLPGAGKRKGAVYVPTPQDFADLRRIGLYHLEAIGRNFAAWSSRVAADMGNWVKPHLQVEYDAALRDARDQGVTLPEDKKLASYKKRLRTMTAKKEALFTEGELGKPARRKIVLDEEGKKLKRAYESARDKFKAAQNAAGVITDSEAETLTELARITLANKENMLKSPRRTTPGIPTVAEMEYGVAQVLYSEYVAELKALAEKKTISEVVMQYVRNPLKVITDVAGTARTICASLDDSFIGRQGLKLFYKGLTGDIQSAKIWADTFVKSFQVIWKSFRGKDVMTALKALQVSDPEYDLILRTRTDISTIEEEVPTDFPSKIPIIGIAFKAGGNAYTYSAHYMRYRVAKMYLDVWRNAGRDMNSKRELEDIGKLANSLTGRGDTGAKSARPGFINNVFWSPRNLKADIDFLTFHMFDGNMSGFAKRRAAVNLLRFITGAGAILLIADFFDDESVTWDTNSANFGKIKIGNTRFSVGGGIPILIVLASRLITKTTTNSITGKKKDINTGKFGQRDGMDLVYGFLENKAAPAASVATELIRQRTREGKKPTFTGVARKLFTPLQIQNAFEAGTTEEAADLIVVMCAEFLGVNVQTYGPYKYEINKTSPTEEARKGSIFE